MAARRFPVEAGHVLLFARALGAADPVERDGESGGVLPAPGDPAPPTFAIAGNQFDPDYPLRPRPGEPWHGSGGDAGLVTAGAGGLHAEQHFTYHRPLRVGDGLSSSTRPGGQWEKEGRSGQLRFREQITEFRDEAGELVVTARSVSVQREASLAGEPRPAVRRVPAEPADERGVPGGRGLGEKSRGVPGGRPPGLAERASELAVGQTFQTVVAQDLKRTQIVQYAGASGDYNPLHTDELYATKIAGYPSVFAHGMLTMGLTGQALAGLVGPENLLRFGVRFTAQVWPGDTLTVHSSVLRIDEGSGGPVAEISVSTVAVPAVSGDGREVVSGYAHARLAR